MAKVKLLNTKVVKKNAAVEPLNGKGASAKFVTEKLLINTQPEGKLLAEKDIDDIERKSLYDNRLTEAKKCAALLYQSGAKRVWLFGSMSDGHDRITRATDIDLAVEGMARNRFNIVRRKIKEEAAYKVDIIYLEDSVPGFRNQILKRMIFIGR